MRKLISLFLGVVLLIPSAAMAASTVSVRVSFTIPERIEIGDNSQAQAQSTTMDAAPAEQAAVTTTTVQNTIVRADKVYLMQTMLPK